MTTSTTGPVTSTPDADGSWVTSEVAAEALGVTKNHVGWLGAQGHLEVFQDGRNRQVSAASLATLLQERARWITLVEAGDLLGCSSKTAQRLARCGHIRQREAPGSRWPSIERASVESYLRRLDDSRF